MLREFRVEPGRRSIAVEIERIEAIEEDVEEIEEEEDDEPESGPRDRAVRERAERRRERQEALPARLELARSVTLAAGSVALVTYDPSGRRLVLVGDLPR
jgi:hypothetical protein